MCTSAPHIGWEPGSGRRLAVPAYPAAAPDGIRRTKEITMRRLMRAAGRADLGMTTAEYAVGTVAACAFGALLYKILTSGFVSSLLQNLISRALHVGL